MAIRSKQNILTFSHNLPLFAGLYCGLTGGLVLAEWIVNMPLLGIMLPEMITMKVNTAICFILLGLMLVLHNTELNNGRFKKLTIFFSLSVLTIAAATSLEYLFKINLGIDEFFIKDIPNAAATSDPGRMSPITAIIFILLSCSFISFRINRMSRMVQTFNLIAFTFSYMACLGYIYGEKTYYGIVPYTQIALKTSIAFFIFSSGLLFLQNRQEIISAISRNNIRGYILKRLIPAVILIPSLMGAVSLYAEHYGFIGYHFGLAFVASASTIILIIIVWMNAKTIDQIDTERKFAESKNLETHRLLNNLIEGSIDPIAALDTKYNFLAYNEAYRAEFRKVYGQDIVMGQCLLDLLDHVPEEKEKFFIIWGRALKGENFTAIEEFGQRESERNFYELRYSSIMDNNKLIGASVIARNITEKKLFEEKLSHLNRLYAVLSQINQLIVRTGI